jgi:hypothetical protein
MPVFCHFCHDPSSGNDLPIIATDQGNAMNMEPSGRNLRIVLLDLAGPRQDVATAGAP